ncbi:ABC transporter ATP-binding protein [Clostridium rectalis]|uniref:ABC transporter ATP-binding protein n=1 Tax=Clostridium rectalis TaxID=2040295 RepID=UPI000F642DDD|nr:ABC transporter ATP-binding protein [Clostridium rectalis]
MKIIETVNLTKRFGEFVANDNINFSVEEGEIHAIVGENGAGKSTLMNCLFGLLKADEGDIYIKGKKTSIASPKDAIKLGIGMVHQHFKLVPSLSIAENVVLGQEFVNGIKVNYKKAVEEVKKVSNSYGLKIDPKEKVQDVSVGVQQRIEILKMLYRDVDILILDEPTAVLTPQEVDGFLNDLIELKNKGKTIIIITHKLNEVKKCSDSVTVIRRGKIIDSVKTKDVDEKILAKMMVGRDVLLKVQKGESNPGDIIYQAKDICTYNKRNIKVLDNVSFHVRSGEILGIAGVEGNGQSEIIKVMSGLLKTTKGVLEFMNKDITNSKPCEIKDMGIGIIPEDRYKHGLCKSMTIYENMICGYHKRKPISNKGFINIKEVKKNTEELINKFDIRIGSKSEGVGKLSGGNAQKVVIAREVSMRPKVLIASQPTRGVDIGSIEFIHKQLINYRDEGNAVVLISSELSEIISLSDRIVVMYKGKIIGEISCTEASNEKLGCLMAGIKEDEKVKA